MISLSSISYLFRRKTFEKGMVFIVNDIVPQFLISFLDDVMYRYIFSSISKSNGSSTKFINSTEVFTCIYMYDFAYNIRLSIV
jgi:hypothetical protein